MDTHETLIQMRQVLVDEGWCTNLVGGPGMPKCVQGARMYVIEGKLPPSYQEEITDVLLRHTDVLPVQQMRPPLGGWGEVCDWNNAQTSIDDILRWLDAAIEDTAPDPQPDRELVAA